MRRAPFAAFAPHCPHCARQGAGRQVLVLAEVRAERADEVVAGILHCPNPSCQLEYPIIDGIPVIVPELRGLLAERGIELLLRDDLDPALESLIGDAMGPGGWFDALRQTVSSYAWDGWADLDPNETPAEDGPTPGAVRRCLERLLDMAGPSAGPNGAVTRALDVGCGAGRSSFTLAERHQPALVLGIDLNFALLRLAQGALHGTVGYPRRRIGLVYDRRRFAVSPDGAARVDFWACDALALPFAAASADLVAALNLLDCVAEPRRLLAGLAELLRPDGRLLLATPYDWLHPRHPDGDLDRRTLPARGAWRRGGAVSPRPAGIGRARAVGPRPAAAGGNRRLAVADPPARAQHRQLPQPPAGTGARRGVSRRRQIRTRTATARSGCRVPARCRCPPSGRRTPAAAPPP